MKGKLLQLNNTIREGAAIPLMIVLYGVPAVLLILFTILITLGIRLLLRKWRERKPEQGSHEDSSAVSASREVMEPVVGWEEESPESCPAVSGETAGKDTGDLD